MPARDVLTVDGVGAPEEPLFGDAIRALFVARARLGGRDDVPLEGRYAQDGDPHVGSTWIGRRAGTGG